MLGLLRRNRVLIAAFLIVIMMWPLDAVVDAYRFHSPGFVDELLSPPGIAVFHRSMLSLLVLLFGLFALWTTRRLYRNQERFNLIMSSINGGLWEWNPDTDVLDCPPHLIHGVLGYTTESRKNKSLESWVSLIDPNEQEEVLQTLRDMSEGRHSRYENVIRMRHQEGHWVHMRLRAFPERQNDDGKTACIIGTCADISEQKRMEEEALLRAEQHDVILATTRDGYWLVDDKGLILETNAAYCDMTGFTIDEIVDHPVSDFEIIETPEETAKHIRKVAEAGFDRFETKHRCKDGRVIDIEVSASYLDKKRQISCFFRDITERKKHKNELLRLSRVVEQTSEGVLIVNRDGIIEYVNPAFCRNTGYAWGEAIGRKPSILKSGAQDDAFYTHMWDAISKGESWSGSVVDRRKDGSFFPALLSIFPIHDEAGEKLYFVGIQQDISDLKRLEDQLIQSQKMEAIGTLVGGIAHDFNNMLASIQACTYLAKKNIDNAPEDSIDKLADIETLTKRAANMIKQMLAFARKDSLQMKSMSLTSFLKESLKLARAAIPENIEFVSDICEDDLLVSGDPTQLQQVVMNLLNNARDAQIGVANPRIECSLHPFMPTVEFAERNPEIQAGRLARLTIRDNGAGIAEDHLNKIFEPFFTTKGVGKGTGLGLAMVYGAIKTHAGLIDVETRPGEGTAFHLYLPLTERPATAKQPVAPAILEGAGETILLVDDEESVRSSTGAVLDSLGYKVLTATDGLQAIAKLEDGEGSIALIISDVVMPKMSGTDLARAIREAGIDTPIIFATGYDKEHSITANQRIDRSVVVKKPFSLQEISQTIRTMIEAG